MRIPIENAAGMAVGETKVFDFLRNGRSAQGFLIRYHDGYHAYLNRCAHWLVPLDLGHLDFYRADIDRIACKTHGAHYRPSDGYCDYGPCLGANLESYPVAVENEGVVVEVPD